MNTNLTQIKVSIPITMKDFLESKASKFGMPVAGYLKHLILKDIEDMDYPIYQASDETEKHYMNALEEIKNGQVTKVNNIEEFLDQL